MEKGEVRMENLQAPHPVIIPLPCFICILCDLKFANQTDLDLHNQLHAGTSGFSCPLCKKILPDLHQLQLHDLQHSLAEAQEDVDNLSDFDIFSQPFASCICIICGESFVTEEELTIHCAVHAEVDDTDESILDDEKENGYIDPILLNPSSAKIVLAKKSFHRPTRPCSRRPPAPFETSDSVGAAKLLFANSVKMEEQQVTYSVIENKVDYLTTGNEGETSTPKAKRRKSKFASTCSRNKCDQCKRIFSNSFSLKRHKSIIHLNKRPYACTFCRKTFIEMSLLTRHTLRNHAPNDYIFTCEHCKEEFAERDLLHRHISLIHNMKYSCEACFKFFAKQEEHTEHMREHVTTFGFDCCRCRRRYKNDWELKRHKCITEGPRPYLCKICGKRFNRKYHLTRHFTVHQTRGGSVGYGVKIECDSEGEIEQPIHVKPRKNKIIHTGRKVDFMSHYKNGRKLILNKKMKFQCYICDVRWPSLRRYKQHFIMAHKKVRFNSCHICGKPFETAYKVRRHLLHHNIPVKTKETTNLERPSNSHNPSSSYEIANQDQKSPPDLKNSNKVIQDWKRDIECYICHQKCSNLRRFKLHFKSQHKGFEFNSCHLCSKKFPNTQKVKSHLTSFHAPVKTEHQVGKLQENFHGYPSEIILYNNPMIAEFENANTYGRGVRKTFTCYICKENCLNYRRYRQHFYIKHKGIKLNACHLCNKQFATTSKVKRHLQSHTHERNFKCHACGKRFAQLSHLKRHRILMHTVKSYRLSKCMYCPKLYADKASFEKHVHMHQLAEQSNFKCSVCQKKFVEERLLDEHILAFHDFFKKYQCPTCRRRFSHQSYLNRHMIIHSMLKKWKCFTCNKRFSTKSDLNRHSLTHTDLKPFPCFFCEKCFTRNSNRQKHISIFHNIRDVDVFDEENDIKPFQNLTDQQKLVMMTFE